MINRLFKAIFISCVMLYSVLSCEQTKVITSSESMNSPITNLKAEELYQKIDSLKGYFCDYPEECERYELLSYIEKRKFQDQIIKRRVSLAQKFLDSFPADPLYYEVLKFYFHMNFEPYFIKSAIDDSLKDFLTKDIQYGTYDGYRRERSWPIDTIARNYWIKDWNARAQQFLNTDAPIEYKFHIEMAVLAREMRHTSKLFFGMQGRSNEWEVEYWSALDQKLWESFRLKMNLLIEKYADMEDIAATVSKFIAFVSNKSPYLKLAYWEQFLEFTGPQHPLTSTTGFKAIRKLAIENLEAIKKVNLNKPLNISITSIDGNSITLENLHGKVVLIDFWSAYCPPCISEMPYMQALYEKYKERGFEIIGLAAEGDKSKNRILEILSKQGATWPQALDKSKENPISYHTLFNINAYPTVWLLDKNGIIVDYEARRERLEPLIIKYLNLEN